MKIQNPANNLAEKHYRIYIEKVLDSILVDLTAFKTEHDATAVDVAALKDEIDATIVDIGALKDEHDATIVDVDHLKDEVDAAIVDFAARKVVSATENSAIDVLQEFMKRVVVKPSAIAKAAGTPARMGIGTNVIHTFDGKFKTAAKTSIAFTVTDHDITASHCRAFLVSINSAGAGRLKHTALKETAAAAVAALPTCPTTQIELGYFTILMGAGTAFVAATTSMLEPGVTVGDITNCFVLARRITAPSAVVTATIAAVTPTVAAVTPTVAAVTPTVATVVLETTT